MYILQYSYHPEQLGWKANMSDAELDAAAKDIVGKMTLDEKISLMGEQSQWSRIKIGLGIIFKTPLPYKAGGNDKFKVPPILFCDGPRGVTFSAGRSTTFPVSMARGASWDPDLERRIGDVIGKESRAVHSNYSGAVCMNLLRHPAWGRAQETYGEDPWHVGEMASALMQGIQEHNVLACLKHFAANSIENSRYVVSANMDERTLREVYLPHFKKCINRGAMTVMSAYNRINGEYCGHNKYLLTDILRGEWKFKGNVTSDWDNGVYDTVKPIKAGMNVEMSFAVYLTKKKVKKALAENLITEKEIDDLVFPTIRTQIWLAARKDPQQYSSELLQVNEHVALAREAAEKSAVLLKNEKNVLPFSKQKMKKIAVVGSLAAVKNTGDMGSSWTHIPKNKIVSPLEGIQHYFEGEKVEVVTADGSDLEVLKKVCADADAVIIAVGSKVNDEGEFISLQPKKMKNKNGSNETLLSKVGLLGLGGDREKLSLDAQDIQTIKTACSLNKNCVVCLIGGSAFTVEEWLQEAPAILQTFFSGMEGGHALARIVFGEVNPSGKLPFSVPVSENDLPFFDAYTIEIDYGYYHGYTLMDKKNTKPRFSFGFGLSYTSFECSDIKVLTSAVKPSEKLDLNVTVKNTGNNAGQEVVQLYIGFSNSKADRPLKLLRGFQKVYLEAGQAQTLLFTVAPEDLTWYDPETKRYLTENMDYEVYVGNTSETVNLLKASFRLEGF